MELQTLHALFAEGKPVSRDSIYVLLQHCSKCKDLISAKQVHLLMLFNGLYLVSALGDVLVRFFASCGCLLDAYLVFCCVSQPTLYTWHAVISACATFGRYEEALDLWREMQEDRDIQPDKVAFLSILKTCGLIRALQQGNLIHKHVIIAGFAGIAAIRSALILMYANCGSIVDSRKVFEEFGSNKDVVIWGTMIAAYTQNGDNVASIELYMKMKGQGIQPDKVAFLCVLKAISNSAEIWLGKAVHYEILLKEADTDIALGSTLVDMYAKCGSMEDAQSAFDKLSSRNVITWNAIIAGYVQYGHGYSALQLYSRMLQQGTLKPEKVTFLCTLKACASIMATCEGRLLHDQILRCELERDYAVASTIIDMYAKWGSIDEAHKVFSDVGTRETVSWNSLIAGYTQQGQALRALRLVEDMQNVGVPLDAVTCTCTLKACAGIESLDCGHLIHDRIVRLELEVDVVIGSALVDMYCKCKSLEEGRNVFEKLRTANVVSWNSIISGCVQIEHNHAALDLFQRMHYQGIVPNDATFSSILKACSNLHNKEATILAHDKIIRCGLEVDAILVCALVDAYAKCGSTREACWMFDRLPNRNVAAWAALIGGYVQSGAGHNALQMFQKMQGNGVKPDKVIFLCALRASALLGAIEEGMLIHEQIVRGDLCSDIELGNTLVDMYTKCGRLYDAHAVFTGLSVRDVVSWCALITGYTIHGDDMVALELFQKMEEEGKHPERSTFLCVLKACGVIGALEQGRTLHEKVVRQEFHVDSAVGNTLVDMYGKCGKMRDANKVFQNLTAKDIVSWNALIAGYALQGNYELIELCLKDMQQHRVKPDSWTYSSIIAACGHAGEVQASLASFERMREKEDTETRLEHFNCVIDALGRAGFVEDAEELLQSMPNSPDNTGRVSVLACSKTHGRLNTGNYPFNEFEPFFASSDVPMHANLTESHRIDAVRSRELSNGREKPWSEAQVKGLNFKVEENACIGNARLYAKPFELSNNQVKTTLVYKHDTLTERKCNDWNVGEALALGLVSGLEGLSIRVTRLHLNCRKGERLAKRIVMLQRFYTIDVSLLFILHY